MHSKTGAALVTGKMRSDVRSAAGCAGVARRRPLIPYLIDPMSGRLRINPALERCLQKLTGQFQPIRSKKDLAQAYVAILSLTIRERLREISEAAIKKHRGLP